MVDRDAYGYVPPGWPDAVAPPGSQDWEASAAAWLLDLIPEYRLYPEVRQHPVVLAVIARHVLSGTVEGDRQGYRTTRTKLGEVVPRMSSTLCLGIVARRAGAWPTPCGQSSS